MTEKIEEIYREKLTSVKKICGGYMLQRKPVFFVPRIPYFVRKGDIAIQIGSESELILYAEDKEILTTIRVSPELFQRLTN